MPEDHCDVAVVGGGPVGLSLGLHLSALGVNVRVLERRVAVSRHSRAVGLHPPALEAFDELGGLGQLLAARGVPIRRGVVRGPGGVLGELNFRGTSRTHPYVLALPQQQTEQLLGDALDRRAPGTLSRGVTVQGLTDRGPDVVLNLTGDRGPRTLRASFVVAADGRRSAVREAVGLPFPGQTYARTYLMGDFPDTTAYRADAVITLSTGGVVESFPLPGGLRRWVTETPTQLDAPRAGDLTRLIGERTGLFLPAQDCSMISAFAVRTHRAPRVRRGRVFLAGDAAHEVSPIGGQGMTLGWLDARDLAPRLTAALGGDDRLLNAYGPARQRSAWRAARQAELNMWLGRPLRGAEGPARELLMRVLLHSPARSLLARAFTMRGL